MKRFVILAVLLAGLGATTWALGALATRTAAEAWMEQRRAEGWVVNLAGLEVAGFPTAFRTAFRGVDMADPETGLAWSTDLFTLDHEVLRLDRIRVRFPAAQILASPRERLTLTHDALEAALDVQPASRFALDRIEARIAGLAVVSTLGWDMAVASGGMAAARVPDADRVYDLSVEARDMVPPEGWRARLDPGSLLPEAIAEARAAARVTFDAPWDLAAIEVARPQPRIIEIDEINARWGDMLFRASGRLEVDADGLPEGDLAVRAENWRAMVGLAANAGLLPERLRPTAEALLSVLAGMSGREEDIDATLAFSDGRVFLGPLPLGPAPRLRLR